MTGWSPDKSEAFRSHFYAFLQHVYISSKETGARTCLGENLYTAQTMFYDAVFDGLANDIHEFYFLKSRQLGASTSTRALSLFWLGIHEGLRGALVFDTATNTASARLEIEETLDNLPPSLGFPKIKSRNRDGLILENDSWLLFRNAGVTGGRRGGGLGRSLGLNFIHASEVSGWGNEEGVTAFRQSLAETYPDRLYIWESTARGYNIWYKLWSAAKVDLHTKRCLFIGWWAKDNQRIERDDPKFDIYGSDAPNPREWERMMAVKQLYGWEVTQEQVAWYRYKTDPARDLDEDDPEDSNIVQEQPWIEEDAFQQTGSSFFQGEKLSALSARLSDMPKPSAYKFWPGTDFVTCDIKEARYRRETELLIWEEPKPDSVYVVAGDPAFGHHETSNNSAAQVLRCYADGIDQVAEYASASIQPQQFAWLLWTLLAYYASSESNCRAVFIVELNGPGEETAREWERVPAIVQRGYLRQAAQDKGLADIFGNVQKYIYTRTDSMVPGHVLFWKTNVQNKVQIMEALRGYVHNGVINVSSLESLEEMRTITRDGDTIGAENQNRDDRTMALALAGRAWDEKLRRGLIASNRTREAERAKVSLNAEDRASLFTRNQLTAMFDRKAALRNQRRMIDARASWRNNMGSRRPQIGRRW